MFSLRYLEDSTADTITLNAPKGVTSEAGANAYAAKLANSPIPTENIQINKTAPIEINLTY